MTLALAWSATVKRRKPSPPRDYATDAKASMRPTPEREIRGRFVSEPIYAHATDGDGTVLTKRTVETRRRRDADADLRTFLRQRFPKLRPGRIEAAVIIERMWDESSSDDRVTADLEGAGGGSSWPQRQLYMLKRIIGREDLHNAVNAVRGTGSEPTRVLDAIIFRRTTVADAGAPVYAKARDASVYVAALLDTALETLEMHLVKEGLMTARREQEREAA